MSSDPMLSHRRAQAAAHESVTNRSDPMSSLVTVEMNLIDACNRKCEFCPHADASKYPNRHDWRMSLSVTQKIASDLASFGYRGRISLSGYGEPFLNKHIYSHVKTLREALPENTIESNTNGDVLREDKIRKVFESGMTYLYVNCYDGPEQLPMFTRMFALAGVAPEYYRLRARWKGPDDSLGIVMNNRGGSLDASQFGHAPLSEPLKQPCHYPAFKMFIDWDGTMLGCANNWSRNTKIGNVQNSHIKYLWMSRRMEQIRRAVFYGDRSDKMCRQCDVNGTLHSRGSVDVLMDHYGWEKQ